jgi:hypothetical protein
VFPIQIAVSALRDGTLTLIILNAYHVQHLFQIALVVIQEKYAFLVKVAIRFRREYVNLVEMRIQLTNIMFKIIYVLFAV